MIPENILTLVNKESRQRGPMNGLICLLFLEVEAMENFFYSIPTKVYFGTDALEHLADCVLEYGKQVLLVYGGGSIKRSGLYDKILAIFKKHKIGFTELSGVEPNPRLATVKKGVELCRKFGVEVILPVGGGSTIDCAKAIAASVKYKGCPWDLVEDSEKIEEVLPIIAIPTAAATGSEMDPYAVITNEELKLKRDMESEALYPAYSLLDPELTYTVPAYQTAAGTADIFSHILEVYFSKVEDTFMQDQVMEALLKTCITYGPIACKEPDNYEARANLLWVSEWAINGFIACGKPGAWPAHSIEHQLSARYDVTHGHGLAVVIPALMEHILNEKSIKRFVSLGVHVFGIEASLEEEKIAEKTIEETRRFLRNMDLSLSLQSLGITDQSKFEEMAEIAASEGLEECLVPLYKEDIISIYQKCF